MKSLKQILEEFDKWYISCGLDPEQDETAAQHVQEGKQLITQSIKDALEACRNEKQDIDEVHNHFKPRVGDSIKLGRRTVEPSTSAYDYTGGKVNGWNANTTQYDENCRKFLED